LYFYNKLDITFIRQLLLSSGAVQRAQGFDYSVDTTNIGLFWPGEQQAYAIIDLGFGIALTANF
jgi:hypothetical protein